VSGAVAAPASAATSNPYTATGVCGASYRPVSATGLPHHIGGFSGIPGATIHLLYNPTTRKNCAVVLRDSPGTPVPMRLDLHKAGDPNGLPIPDIGLFRYFAGPLYVSAPGQCVTVGAGIDRLGETSAGYSDGWDSRPVACG
jgi:hypothetical protein